jgi:hypothetical protein
MSAMVKRIKVTWDGQRGAYFVSESCWDGGAVVMASDYDAAIAVLRALTTNPHLDLGDLVYTVRERELQGWDGPAVTAWSDAVLAVQQLLKDADHG